MSYDGWGEPCQSRDRVTIRLFGSREVWHRLGVGQVKFAELLALRTKYGQFLRQRQAEGNTSDVQTYACRDIRGSTTTYSNHSWPRAVDIQPSLNPMRDDGVLECNFTNYGFVDGFRFVSSFIAASFDWGANWITEDQRAERISRWDLRRIGKKIRDGRVDAMHFEIGQGTGPWTDRKVVRKLRAYRAKHPVYMAGVLKAAKVNSCVKLLRAWKSGDA